MTLRMYDQTKTPQSQKISDNYDQFMFINTIEVKKSESGEVTLEGKAAPYGENSVKRFWFYERFEKGCFDDCLNENKHNIAALVAHDSRLILARESSGTVKMTNREDGLYYYAKPNMKLSFAQDLIAQIETKDVEGVSVGIDVWDTRWTEFNGEEVRIITSAGVLEFSFTGFPAFTNTDVALRSYDTFKRQKEYDSQYSVKQQLDMRELELQALEI